MAAMALMSSMPVSYVVVADTAALSGLVTKARMTSFSATTAVSAITVWTSHRGLGPSPCGWRAAIGLRAFPDTER